MLGVDPRPAAAAGLARREEVPRRVHGASTSAPPMRAWTGARMARPRLSSDILASSPRTSPTRRPASGRSPPPFIRVGGVGSAQRFEQPKSDGERRACHGRRVQYAAGHEGLVEEA